MKRRESMTEEPFAPSLFPFFLSRRPFAPSSASLRALCTLHSPVSATGRRYTVPTFYALHAASSRFLTCYPVQHPFPLYSRRETLAQFTARTHTAREWPCRRVNLPRTSLSLFFVVYTRSPFRGGTPR